MVVFVWDGGCRCCKGSSLSREDGEDPRNECCLCLFLSPPFVVGGSATVDVLELPVVVAFRPADDEETAPTATFAAAAAVVVESGLRALSFLPRWSMNPRISDVTAATSSFDLSRKAERRGDWRWSMPQETPDSCCLTPFLLQGTFVSFEIQTVENLVLTLLPGKINTLRGER